MLRDEEYDEADTEYYDENEGLIFRVHAIRLNVWQFKNFQEPMLPSSQQLILFQNNLDSGVNRSLVSDFGSNVLASNLNLKTLDSSAIYLRVRGQTIQNIR